MRKRRVAAFERRQQMYRLENEEGYEEDALVDGLPQEEEEAEMTDKSDTEDEEESDVGEEGEEKDWVRRMEKERLEREEKDWVRRMEKERLEREEKDWVNHLDLMEREKSFKPPRLAGIFKF